jgi:hypothetical protein
MIQAKTKGRKLPKKSQATMELADSQSKETLESTSQSKHIQLATPEETARLARLPAEPFDFVRGYVEYADIIEAPREAHQAVAIQMLAAALNPRVRIQHGGVRIPLDLWILLLSASGMGRNTLVSLAAPILKGAGLQDMMLNTTWGSKQAFYQNISVHPSGLFTWPEMSEVLRKLSDPKFAGAKEWLTDRYDNLNIPEKIAYRETARKTDTPPIVFRQAPRLNILATSSFDWFTSSLAQEDTTGGFIPRFLVLYSRGRLRAVPIPGVPDYRMVPDLAGHLAEVSMLEGVADLSGVQEPYKEWYLSAQERFRSQPNSALAMPFFNRLRANVLKLALVFQVSQALTLRVSLAAMARAIETAHACEQDIFSLLPTGMNREGSAVGEVEERIRQAESDGLLKSAFTRAFQHVRTMDRDSRLATLLNGEVVFRFWRNTSGRRAEMLVHKDHVEEYARRFPIDERG